MPKKQKNGYIFGPDCFLSTLGGQRERYGDCLWRLHNMTRISLRWSTGPSCSKPDWASPGLEEILMIIIFIYLFFIVKRGFFIRLRIKETKFVN